MVIYFVRIVFGQVGNSSLRSIITALANLQANHDGVGWDTFTTVEFLRGAKFL